MLHHLAVDLDAINSWSGHLIPDDSLAAMFSGAIALLAPKLSQASRIVHALVFVMGQASQAAGCLPLGCCHYATLDVEEAWLPHGSNYCRLLINVDAGPVLCSILQQRRQSKWPHPAQKHWLWHWPEVLHCRGCSRRHAV